MSFMLLTYDLPAGKTDTMRRARDAFKESLVKSGWFKKIAIDGVIRHLPNTTYVTRASRPQAFHDFTLARQAGLHEDAAFEVKRWIIVDSEHVGSGAFDDASHTHLGVLLSLPI